MDCRDAVWRDDEFVRKELAHIGVLDRFNINLDLSV